MKPAAAEGLCRGPKAVTVIRDRPKLEGEGLRFPLAASEIDNVKCPVVGP